MEILKKSEIDYTNGSVAILKTKYITETDINGVEITKPINWRVVVAIGDESSLQEYLPPDQANNIINVVWTDELKAKVSEG